MKKLHTNSLGPQMPTAVEAWSIEKLIGRAKTLYHDPGFQRPRSWKEEREQDYITCLLNRGLRSPIYFAEVKVCLQVCKKRLLKGGAEQGYFEELVTNGFTDVCIDGQNRTGAIVRFVNNVFPIQDVLLSSTMGRNIWIPPDSPKYFKDLPEDWQEYFLNEIHIHVYMVQAATRSDLARAFSTLNQGEQLNRQEQRNAFLVPIAEEVRLRAQQPFRRPDHTESVGTFSTGWKST